MPFARCLLRPLPLTLLLSCTAATVPRPDAAVHDARETHLTNVRQLTFGGENAEAYFNLDGTSLVFQSKRQGLLCDQIFRMKTDGRAQQILSSGKGRTTCAYFQNDGSVIYASTHGHAPDCLWSPDMSEGYVWPLYPEMDIWTAAADGSDARLLFGSDGYDAEATVCPKDGRIIFTSTKDGDLDLYIMQADGSDVRQITNTPGYDGGAFFSPDCEQLVWRASRPTGAALDDYQSLLKKNRVRPGRLEIFVANTDGTNVRQVTQHGAASFAPYMHPKGDRLLYVSNRLDPKGRNFDIFLLHLDSGQEEQITFSSKFDGFPMWSHDGAQLVFASNRNNRLRGETNIFIADWVD